MLFEYLHNLLLEFIGPKSRKVQQNKTILKTVMSINQVYYFKRMLWNQLFRMLYVFNLIVQYLHNLLLEFIGPKSRKVQPNKTTLKKVLPINQVYYFKQMLWNQLFRMLYVFNLRAQYLHNLLSEFNWIKSK